VTHTLEDSAKDSMEDSAKEYHPTPDMLERFLRGKLDPADCRGLVRHLLTGCPVCRAVTGRLWGSGGPARPGTPRQERPEEQRLFAVVD
jgi:hypothetical protein